MLRSIDALPKQGAHLPWRVHQNYARDILMFRRGTVADTAIEFAGPKSSPRNADPAERLAV